MKKKKVIKDAQVKKTTNRWGAILINTFAIVVFGGAFVWMGITVYNETTAEKKMEDQYLTSLPDVKDTIEHSKVCMVEDVYQGDYPSVSVSINDKIYYGCSQKATKDLTTMDSLRFAIDPVSKKKVDKATAIIAIHPDKDGKVMYFGSKDTYNKYFNVLKKENEKK